MTQDQAEHDRQKIDNREPDSPVGGQLRHIADAVSSKSLPPVHDWQPEITRPIDIRIERDGTWLYQGSPIARKRMVALFSSVLRMDDDGHTYLVTPQERLLIEVEDAPFTAVLVDRHGAPNVPTFAFTTNVGEHVLADAEHPVSVRYECVDGEPSPYVLVRDRLLARLSRSVFLELTEHIESVDGRLGVHSAGVFMPLDADPSLGAGGAVAE